MAIKEIVSKYYHIKNVCLVILWKDYFLWLICILIGPTSVYILFDPSKLSSELNNSISLDILSSSRQTCTQNYLGAAKVNGFNALTHSS